MGLMSWLVKKFGSCATASSEKRADAAIETASEVIHKSRSIRAQLEPYKDRPDPFFEVFRNARASKRFEAKTELETPRARPE